ncbi:MAG: hypothetical protein JNN07_14740 [Verrucomicrobiales bacterium]|nr:hypothetical protein [Verrucomicrobiales bacterium]
MARSNNTQTKWVRIARELGAIPPAPPEWKDCELVFDVRPDTPADLAQPQAPGGGVILKDAHGKAVLGEILWVLILAAFAVALTYGTLFAKGAQGLRSQTGPFLFVVSIIGLFDLFFVVIIWNFSYRILKYFRFGSPKIGLSAYPLILGREFSVGISNLPPGLSQLSLTLRCLGERSYSRRRDNQHEEWVTEYYALHRVEGSMGLDSDGTGAQFSGLLPDLPNLATRAGDPCSIFWDLVIRGERRGLDFEARFVIPVFSPTET